MVLSSTIYWEEKMKHQNWLLLYFIIIISLGLIQHANAQVFIKDGKAMSCYLVVKFKKEVVNIPVGEKYASVSNITAQGSDFKNYLSQFNETIVLEKMIPHAKPNDTLWVNSRGETKKLNDWSQVFVIKFQNPKEIEIEVGKIRKMVNVEYVEP